MFDSQEIKNDEKMRHGKLHYYHTVLQIKICQSVRETYNQHNEKQSL